MNKSKKLVLFDFDGTLTHKDTLIEFLRFYCGSAKLYFAMFLIFPQLLGMKLKILDPDLVKKKLLSHLLKNEPQQKLMKRGIEFCDQVLPSLLRKEGMATLKNQQDQQAEIALVTASLDIWVAPFAQTQHIKLLCTKAQFKDELYTGSFDGKNCNRDEKAIRIKKEFDLNIYSEIIAYGDSSGDKAMFALATQTYFKPFRN